MCEDIYLRSIYKCDYNTSLQWQFCLNLESIASVQIAWSCCMKVNTELQVDWVEYSKEDVIILYPNEKKKCIKM